MTEWKDIPKFPNYAVSFSGTVKNKKTGRILKNCKGLGGYAKVTLYGDKKYNKTLHRLVDELFIPNPDGLPLVNHKDENRMNPHGDNLEWCTEQYNHEYSKAKNYTLISPEGEVVDVFNLKKFCRDHGLDSGNMSKVVSGERKSHRKWRSYHC
jgi:hypothetical protein